MNCAICKHNDGNIYTSIPVKYRCKITGEYHEGLYNCDVEFAPVRHGRWIIYPVSPWDGEDVKCSVCGEKGCAPYWDYCPHCGSQMVDVVSENEL